MRIAQRTHINFLFVFYVQLVRATFILFFKIFLHLPFWFSNSFGSAVRAAFVIFYFKFQAHNETKNALKRNRRQRRETKEKNRKKHENTPEKIYIYNKHEIETHRPNKIL